MLFLEVYWISYLEGRIGAVDFEPPGLDVLAA